MAKTTIKPPPGFGEPVQSRGAPATGILPPPGFSPPREQQVATNNLITMLRGRLPSTGPLPAERVTQRPSGFPFGIAPISVPNVGRQEEIVRRQAFTQLSRQGFSPEQIDLTLQTQRKLRTIEGPRIGRMIAGTAGAIAAGQLIPGPVDELIALRTAVSALGAGVGGIAGEAIQTGIDEKRLIGRRETLHAFATEAGFEAGARLGVMGLKFAASPFIKKTIPEAASLAEEYGRFGGHFSPTELDRRWSLRVQESFARGAWAEDAFAKFETRQRNTALDFANSMVDDIVGHASRESLEDIGEEFAESIAKPGGRIFKLMDDLFTPLYNELDDLTKATTVSTDSLKVFRKKIIADNQRLVKIAKRTGKEFPLLSPAGEQILTDIDNLPPLLGHSDYRAFRTKILAETRKLNRDVDVSKGMVKRVSGITRDELLNPASVGGASPEAKRLHTNISRLYAATEDALETTFSPKLAKRLAQNPSSVVREVVRNKNPKALRQLRVSLTHPIAGRPNAEGQALWNDLRRAWMANAVDEASKTGVIRPKVFDNIIRKLGPDTFTEMFPEPQLAARMKKIGTLFQAVGRKPPTSAALVTKGIQAAGVVKMYQGATQDDFIGFTIGGLLTFSPYAIAKLATTPNGVKFLTAGFKLKPGASGLVPFAARAIKLSREIDKRDQKEKQTLRETAKRIERQRRLSRFRKETGLGPIMPPPRFPTPPIGTRR